MLPTNPSFLPEGFDPRQPVAVMAGRQLYPVLTVQALRQRQIPVRLIAFAGETREDLVASFPPQEVAMIKVGQLGKMLRAVRDFGVRHCIMIGQITPGRLFRDLHPDLHALKVLATLKERNATTIFGAICRELEKIGAQILDARCFVEEHLAGPGVMTGGRLKEEMASIEYGVRMARAVASLEIGQGVVVRKGTVLSVEAFEGTDEMLRRANKYRTDRLIFVKTSKPGQDYRYDVPCFGLGTIEAMKASGIGLACLESDRTLLLDKPAVLAAATAARIQIYGYSAA